MPQFGAKPLAGAFLDSDFTSLDSLLAVGLLHGLQGKNECRLAIITMSRPNLAVAGYVDAVERYYRGPAGNFSQVPPVGMITSGDAGDTPAAYTLPFQLKNADGAPLYQNQVHRVIDTGDPATLIRNYLQAQQDQGAFFVLAGPATNLAAALDFPGVKDLIAAKVRCLAMAAGAFPSGPAEPHLRADLPAARKLLSDWPTPIVAAGREVGLALEFPGAAFFNAPGAEAANHPIVDAYRAGGAAVYNLPSGAMAAALHAARPREDYFKMSGPGRISLDAAGATTFTASGKGSHQYLIVDPARKEKVILAYLELAATKPVPRRFGRPPAADQQQQPIVPEPEKQ